MSRTGVFMTKNELVALRILEEFRYGKTSRKDTALLLGCSERAVSRRATKVREKGAGGVKHGNNGREAANQTDGLQRAEMLRLAKEVYFDFNMAHCLEMLRERHSLSTSYATFHKWCRDAGIGKVKRRRTSKARVHRERMARAGFMLQMDGSHHDWNGRDRWCLIALIDDATSEIPAARFFHGETTWGCMTVLRAVIEVKGVPQIIYTDEAGWAGGGVKRHGFSQFVRACEELGIRVITTSSAESKGRIERVWRTTQDRLIPELRLNEIKSMTDANRYLDQVYLPKYWNIRNTVHARDYAISYRPLDAHENLQEIFCLKYTRQIGSDHTVNFENTRYRITDRRYGSLKKKAVSVHVYENGLLALFFGHLQLEFEKITLPVRTWRRLA